MIEPYYQNNWVTLYKGEALAVLRELPDESIDAVITDPPYSSGGMVRGDRTAKPDSKYTQSESQGRWTDFTGDNRDGHGWAYWCALWMSECRRLVKPSGYFLSFTDWRMLPTLTDAIQAGGFAWRGIVSWDKGEGARAPHTGFFRHQCEYIVWGTNGVTVPAEHGGHWPGVFRQTVKQSDKHHMTGKPTTLMRELCQIVPEGSTILDPFAGSGTTLRAAADVGRKAIGCELVEEYCNVAAARFRQGVIWEASA